MSKDLKSEESIIEEVLRSLGEWRDTVIPRKLSAKHAETLEFRSKIKRSRRTTGGSIRKEVGRPRN